MEKNELVEKNDLPTMQRIQFAELIDQGLAGKPLMETKNPLLSVKTLVKVQVGQFEMSVGDFLAAKEHQIFELDQKINQEVDLVVEDKVVARGMLVAVGDNFAVKVTTPPKSI